MNIKTLLILFVFSSFLSEAQINKEFFEKAIVSKDSSDFYFKKAKKQIKSKDDEAAYFFYKNALCTELEKQDSAIYYGKMALKKLENSKDYNSILTLYFNIANVYNNKGQYEKSIGYNISGLKIAEKTGLKYWEGTFCVNLSYDYHDFENYSKGIVFGKRGIKIFTTLNNVKPKDIRSAFNATAINYDDWNKPEMALYYHKQNLIYLKGKDTLLLNHTYNNIGNTLLKQKKFEEAKKWILRSVAILDYKLKMNDLVYIDYNYATCYTNLATIASELNRFQEAENYFDLALKYSKKSQVAEKIRDYFYQKALFNKKYNNLEATIKEQGDYIAFRDSVYTSERNQTAAELEAKYQNEKKENQILQQEAESRKKNIWLLFVTSILLIVGILFRNFRIKSKLQKEQLELENTLIEERSNYKIQEQRLEISRELHDNVGSQLTFIISILDNLKSSPVPFGEAIDKKIDTLSSFATKSIAELRDTIWVLNSKKLELDRIEIPNVKFHQRCRRIGR
jgi:tetratricopeptide (TPR) repeat protein